VIFVNFLKLDFITSNSDSFPSQLRLFFQNFKFISHSSSDFVTRNCEFIPHNSDGGKKSQLALVFFIPWWNKVSILTSWKISLWKWFQQYRSSVQLSLLLWCGLCYCFTLRTTFKTISLLYSNCPWCNKAL